MHDHLKQSPGDSLLLIDSNQEIKQQINEAAKYSMRIGLSIALTQLSRIKLLC